MLVALGVSGFCMGLMAIPNMAEMLRVTKEKFPEADMGHANHLLSGMLCSSFGLGQALGPIIGALIYEKTDFRTMCNAIGGATISFSILYFLCCQGFTAYRLTFASCCSSKRRTINIYVTTEDD